MDQEGLNRFFGAPHKLPGSLFDTSDLLRSPLQSRSRPKVTVGISLWRFLYLYHHHHSPSKWYVHSLMLFLVLTALVSCPGKSQKDSQICDRQKDAQS